MNKTTWIIFVLACVALLGGLVYMSRGDKIDVSNIDQSKAQSPSEMSGNIGDHVYGNKNAKVTLIEYGDFQCPACGSAFSTMKTLKENNKDTIQFIFRNFPLGQLHPNARAAAASAEAAGMQGKFWEMHDLLYAQQKSWESLQGDQRTKMFESYASQIGLNVKKFQADIASDTINKKLDFDSALAKKSDATGTPTFYLNNKQVTELVKDGKVVTKGTDGALNIWQDAAMFQKELIDPLLKK